MPLIPALPTERQVDLSEIEASLVWEFQANQCYTVRLSQNNNKSLFVKSCSYVLVYLVQFNSTWRLLMMIISKMEFFLWDSL